jgi:serine/threonine protein kinase
MFSQNIPTFVNKKKYFYFILQMESQIRFEEDLATILSYHNYEYIKEIGKGSFGVCCLVNSLKYQTSFVCKAFKFSPDFKTNRILNHSFNLETRALVHVDHPNILKIYDYFQHNNYCCLILEYCSGGSLQSSIAPHRGLSEEKLLRYLPQITSALAYIHHNNIAHLDIKPGNILIDNYGRSKLADFGLSHFCDEKKKISQFCGSMFFTAPEIFSEKPYDPFKADIWSLGVTLYLLASGKFPYLAKTGPLMLEKISKGHKPLKDKVPEIIRKIVTWCLQIDPNNRPTASQLNSYILSYTSKPEANSTTTEKRLKLTKIGSIGVNLSRINYLRLGRVPSVISKTFM